MESLYMQLPTIISYPISIITTVAHATNIMYITVTTVICS